MNSMNETQLSKRLEKVASFVEKGSRVADIGSDHAYLPVYLLRQGISEFAVAGEVVEGPFQSATNQVKKNQLTDKISVRIGDGLEVVEVEDHIDTITIAGMGGSLIASILDSGVSQQKISGAERLILQPNVGEEVLRKWLQKEGYRILEEAILEEDQKIYEIIVAEKASSGKKYSQRELLLGPILITQPNEVFCKKWQRELKQLKFVKKQLAEAKTQQTEKINELNEKIAMIEEGLGKA